MKNLILITTLLFSSLLSKETDYLYSNYVEAINNDSTFQFYLVIQYKNLNTGEIREICTQGNALKGAIHREYQLLDYSEESVAKVNQILLDNKIRYFEFKNKEAIANLNPEIYAMEDLKTVEQKIDFDKLTKKIRRKKSWKESLERKDLLLYAHALFNRGILTGESNCVGGSLVYIKDPNHL